MHESDQNSGDNKPQIVNDNRKYPRVEAAGNVILAISNEESLNSTLQDISPDGLQVRFDNETALAMKPLIDLISDNTINDFEIRFALSIAGREEQITAKCRPIYITKIEQNLFGMGIQFTDITGDHTGYIQQFIEHSMEPM